MAESSSQEAVLASQPENPDAWHAVHEHARAASCAFNVCSVTAYDVYQAGSHQASGNVVDKLRGFVITNGHVVGDGPSLGYVVLNETRQVGRMLSRLSCRFPWAS